MGHANARRLLYRIVYSLLPLPLLSLALLATPVAFAGTAADAAARTTSPSSVTRLIVRFRPAVQPAAGEVIDAALWADLNATTGDALAGVSTTKAGDQVLTLAHPVDPAEARRLLGALRMRPDVLWAESERNEARVAAAKLKRKSAEAPANISRFIVLFTDPALSALSRDNGRPGPEWDELLSAGAGVPLRILRATVGGAWVVGAQTAVTASVAEALAEKLEGTSGIASASPDYPAKPHAYFPNDTYYQNGHQRDLADPFTTIYYGVDAPEAWDITVGSDLVVAIVDTGVRPHGEFASRMVPGYTFISDPAKSHDGLGRHPGGLDVGDWAAADECGSGRAATDSDWHGTHVTGTIAATGDNTEGIAGLNWYSAILPVRVLGTCGGSTSDIIDGIAWATGLPVPGVPANPNPARVINMSLGGPGPCSPLFQSTINQVLAAGTFIAVSAGNDAEDIEGSNPANCFGVSTVSATDPYGYLASYSNFGANVDISAPGGDKSRYGGDTYGIWSTLNTGKTSPEFSTYGAYQGTSMASPHVAGVASLMLSVNPALTPAQIKTIMGDTSSNFAADSVCRTDGTCGPGIVNAYYAVKEALRIAPNNYDGLWWAAPGGIESGWGINFSHQGDVIFATWFTYDGSGKAWWLSMTANKVAENVYSGALIQTRGPSFNAVPFNPAAVSATQVGAATLSFASANAATFQYTVGGVSQTKTITHQVFGPLPRCTFGALNSLALATNYQGLWWNAPAGSESGWGVNLTQEGDVIFGTWFTYDLDGTPVWLSVTARYTGGSVYSGTLFRTTGPAFNSVPFNPAGVTGTPVGTASFNFVNGNSASFGYTFRGIAQTKAITRQVFRAPGTACES